MNQTANGKRKRWMSADCGAYSRNLRASSFAGRQQQFGDRKVWWFGVLARGRVGIHVMRDGWRQTGAGMAEFVKDLEGALRGMLGDEPLPRIVFSDRGPGFYQSSTGHIVKEHAAALKQYGSTPLAGEDASKPPPDIADLLIHETGLMCRRRN